MPRQEVFPSATVSEAERRMLAFARYLSSAPPIIFADANEFRSLEMPKLEIPTLEIPIIEIPSIKIEPLPDQTGKSQK